MSPGALRGWFAERGLMSGDEDVRPADLRRAIDVREGLRAVLLHNNGHALDGERVARLDRAVRRAGVRVRVREGGTRTRSWCPTPTAWTAP